MNRLLFPGWQIQRDVSSEIQVLHVILCRGLDKNGTDEVAVFVRIENDLDRICLAGQHRASVPFRRGAAACGGHMGNDDGFFSRIPEREPELMLGMQGYFPRVEHGLLEFNDALPFRSLEIVLLCKFLQRGKIDGLLIAFLAILHCQSGKFFGILLA